MSKSLVIVESPAKAKTIEKYLGDKYQVASSVGHIRDLPKKDMGIDIKNGFKPLYEISDDKRKVVSDLKKMAKDAEMILLATDEDREGEAIAWHLYESLDVKNKPTKRIVFHEITKPAILKAIENPRDLDINLVDAQQARRILDRLVGYELSPVLWKKVRRGLSAGRVQSVAVRIIVDREREIESFTSSSTYKVTAEFYNADERLIKAELKQKFDNFDDCKLFLSKLINVDFKVIDLEKKALTRTSSAPFTTSTLQQEASRKLGYSVRQTMSLAQKLYENGHITYMRTDSLNLSEIALDQAGEAITSMFGSRYHKRQKYETKSASAQEAHEAIRPTDMTKPSIKGESNQIRLYDLIWKRTLASQMANAQLEKTIITIASNVENSEFIASGEVIVFDGFLKVYEVGRDEEKEEDENKLLPAVKIGEALNCNSIYGREIFKRPPARYTEASLVKKLEEMGIGRPSTYAPTISTIQDREYIVKDNREAWIREFKSVLIVNASLSTAIEQEKTGEEKSKLFPTDMGMIVTDFLVKHFPDIVDYNFTAKVEEEFDEIANGNKVWQEMIANFYTPFHSTIEKSEDISRQEVSQQRFLGNDPKSNKPIYAKIGRFGPMYQMGDTEDEEKPKFASLLGNQRIDSVTLDDALKQFELPRILGLDENGKEISIQIGRFGPYIKVGSVFVSIKQEQVFEIELDEAIILIKAKIEQTANNTIHNWEENGIKVLKGRWGPYITDGLNNAKIPKEKDPLLLTLDECVALIDALPNKKVPKKAKAEKKVTKSTTKKLSTKSTNKKTKELEEEPKKRFTIRKKAK